MAALSSSISRKSEKMNDEQYVEDNTAALFCDKQLEVYFYPVYAFEPQAATIDKEACSNLTKFYSGSRALEFPRLSHITIAKCPKMTTFSSSNSSEQDAEDNTTTLFCHKVAIPNLTGLILSSINIRKIWHHPSSSSLTHLWNLRVEGCHNLKYLFPSFLVKDLVRLYMLEIKDCNMMEQVIFTDGLATEDQWRNHAIFSKLKWLSLEDLPKLKDTCFETDFEFPCLERLTLTNCPLLKTFISKSVSGDEPPIHQPTQTNNTAVLNEKVVFPHLENLHIHNCDSLEEIIELQGLTANESQSTSATRFTMAETVTTKFVFPHDTFPVLQELTLKTSDMMKGICDGQLSLQCFPNLELLNLQFFPEASTTLPYSFIRSLPKLQKLFISNASISEIVRSEGLSHKERHTSAFSQLKELSLSELPELALKTLFEGLINEERHTTACYQLEALRLSQLPELTVMTLEPFLLSFKNLLSILTRQHCFSQLKYLKLSHLPSLASFSLAHHSLEFPVLQMVRVTECPNMKNFCHGELSTPRLDQMHLKRDEDGELQWEGDLNTTIKHMFDETNVQNSQVVEVTDQLLQME
ncbi:hypothetical protein GOBAR_AA08703 [Gossypium barbadense]|uniref:Disease resistance protein At4g27190-like leucine-rich repeats domain-containing protein n=1 Tax=Gossypium barbadense TaxID=3634 RepID=A0A2P5Y8L7_GOSBA|nr:hypothetical protein GOBAR_AA08703 [Gossypium barbadense]